MFDYNKTKQSKDQAEYRYNDKAVYQQHTDGNLTSSVAHFTNRGMVNGRVSIIDTDSS